MSNELDAGKNIPFSWRAFKLLAPPFLPKGLQGKGDAELVRWGDRQSFRFLFVALLTILSATPSFAASELAVGSKRFPESYILGEILTCVAQDTQETQVAHRQGLGNTGVVFAALKTGDIDVYPEYTGTISQELLKNKTTVDLPTMNRQLAPLGLAVGIPLGFNDTYALAMREDKAESLGIRTLSDLAKHPEVKLGLSQEFIGRADGWKGVVATYHMPQGTPQGFDHAVAYQALVGGQVDVVDVYSTDAEIQQYKLRVLEDDRHFFPEYDAVLLYRKDLPTRLPKTWAAFEKLAGKIPAARMIEMNADAKIRKRTFTDIAANFVAHDLNEGRAGQALSQGTQSFSTLLFGPDFWKLTGQHLWLVFVSLALSIILGVPLGIWAAKSRLASQPILSTVGVIQTIPSLALLAFLIPVFHQIGRVPALVALILYALLPIVRNTYTGLVGIAPGLRESAMALGLPAGARLRLIELPLAARTILAGIKTSAIINVGTATIAALIGAGGYGERITSGLALNDTSMMLAGAIPAAVLALLVQGLFEILDRVFVPKGLRTD